MTTHSTFLLAVSFGMSAVCSTAAAQNNVSSQGTPFVRIAPDHKIAAEVPKVNFTGNEDVPYMPLSHDQVGDIEFVQSREMVIERQIIGLTQYDLQSNYGIDDRSYSSAAGTSTGWIQSLETSPFSDRGTGYNFLGSGEEDGWSETPFERIEDVRIGWPSLLHTGDGMEHAISHGSLGTLVKTSREIGSGEWTTSNLPEMLDENGDVLWNLWPRACSGGPDGNTIHAICITAPVGNGGVLYGGQDGALIYMRSTNGGADWTQQTFAETDSTHFTGFIADSYAIHADGDNVAFAVFGGFDDTFTMHSEDNGETWTYETVIDFPVDLYVIDSGLPDSLADDTDADGNAMYFNSDRAGDVLIDNDGGLHLFFGGMYYSDPDTTDDTSNYYPYTNGLEYWTPAFGTDSSQTIAYAYDEDDSGTLDYDDEIAGYFVSVSGQPSAGQSVEDGRLVVAYSSMMESYSTGLQNFRHIHLVQSTDGGATWNSDTPCNVTPDLDFDLIESIYPSIPSRIYGDELVLHYQSDFEPGLHVRGDEDPVGMNDIVALRITLADLAECADLDFEDYVGLDEMNLPDFGLYPNPTSDQVEIVLDALLAGSKLRVLSLDGRLVFEGRVESRLTRLSVADWAPGVYAVELSNGASSKVERLLVR